MVGRGEDRAVAVGVRQSVMVHAPQEAEREDRGCSVEFLLFIQFRAPAHKIALSTLTAILPTSILT